MKVAIELSELKNIIKEAVREVIQEEKIKLILQSLPYVSDKEMEDIIQKYGKPPKKKQIALSEG